MAPSKWRRVGGGGRDVYWPSYVLFGGHCSLRGACAEGSSSRLAPGSASVISAINLSTGWKTTVTQPELKRHFTYTSGCINSSQQTPMELVMACTVPGIFYNRKWDCKEKRDSDRQTLYRSCRRIQENAYKSQREIGKSFKIGKVANNFLCFNLYKQMMCHTWKKEQLKATEWFLFIGYGERRRLNIGDLNNFLECCFGVIAMEWDALNVIKLKYKVAIWNFYSVWDFTQTC